MIWIDYAGKQIEQAPFVIAAAVAVMIAAAAFLSGRHRLEGRWQQHLDGNLAVSPRGKMLVPGLYQTSPRSSGVLKAQHAHTFLYILISTFLH